MSQASTFGLCTQRSHTRLACHFQGTSSALSVCCIYCSHCASTVSQLKDEIEKLTQCAAGQQKLMYKGMFTSNGGKDQSWCDHAVAVRFCQRLLCTMLMFCCTMLMFCCLWLLMVYVGLLSGPDHTENDKKALSETKLVKVTAATP